MSKMGLHTTQFSSIELIRFRLYNQKWPEDVFCKRKFEYLVYSLCSVFSFCKAGMFLGPAFFPTIDLPVMNAHIQRSIYCHSLRSIKLNYKVVFLCFTEFSFRLSVHSAPRDISFIAVPAIPPSGCPLNDNLVSKAVLRWSLPENNGGNTIQNYQVT